MKINNIELNYKVKGEGFPIILIHGFSDDLNYWENLDELSKYFKLVSLDLRGHGKTEFGSEEISIGLMSDDVYKLAKNLNIDKCHVIGFSLGGNVAIDLTLNHPDLVSKLILISSFAKCDENTRKCFNDFSCSLDENLDAYRRTILPHVLPEELIPEELEEIDRPVDIESLKKILEMSKEYDELDEINQIKAETLIISSKEDTLTKVSLAHQMHDAIKNSKIVLLDYYKHNPFIGENIKKLNELIRDFLRDE